MKRSFLAFLFVTFSALLMAQVSIDKPAATLKLTKQEIISVRQLKADIEKIEALTKKKLTPEQQKQLLDAKINSLLFFQYCDRERILAPEVQINTAITKLKANLGPNADDAALVAAFQAQGILVDPRTYIKQQILFETYLRTKKADALKNLQPPTSADVLKAYDLLKANLVRPDTLRLSVIYVDLRSLSPDDKKKAADAMRQVAAQLKTAPEKFDELMIRATDAGALYKATPSIYVEKTPQFQQLYGELFMDRAFKLKAGEQSDLIENEAGLQIVRVNEVLPQKQLTLADTIPGKQGTVQDLIMQNLAQERQASFLASIQEELIAQLRKESEVKIYEENLNF